MTVADTPGGLLERMESLSAAGINVEYVYAFATTSAQEARVVIKVDNLERAARIVNGETAGQPCRGSNRRRSGVLLVMAIRKSYEEINAKIRAGQAVVVTAEEIIPMVAEQGAEKVAQTVDVVTTATLARCALPACF